MEAYQREFIEFALDCGVLRFGEFELKSGRKSPYFFNAGLFNTGASLARLGRYYAAALAGAEADYDILFGPAYKGIVLVAATAIGVAERSGRDVPYAFDRKEAKDHGEGGLIVGAPLNGRVIVVDDVMSSGRSVREAANIIAGQGALLAGVCIALDRQERGAGELTAVQEVVAEHGVPVFSVIKLEHIRDFLAQRPAMEVELNAIAAYLSQYGVEV